MDVQVLPPEETAVEVRAVITPAAGFSVEEAAVAAEQALRGYFTGELLGKGVKVAQLGDLLYHLEAVENYRMTAPAGDLTGAVGVLPVLSDVVLTGEA